MLVIGQKFVNSSPFTDIFIPLDSTRFVSIHCTTIGVNDMAYKNPPKKMRFRPGVSGNPLGRPANIPDSDVLYLVRALQVILAKATAQLRNDVKSKDNK